MKRLLLTLVFAALLFPVTRADALPEANDARPVATPSWGPSTMSAISHAVASNGTHRLVAWGGDDDVIFAMRYGTDGLPADAEPVLVSTSGSISDVEVATDGTDFLVVWEDRAPSDDEIRAARISQDGALLDTTPITVSKSGATARDPDVAWNGSAYQVVWADLRNGAFDVFGNRLQPDGTVLDGD